MPDRSDASDWSDVDAQPDSEAFAEYLVTASAEEQVQRYKRRSHELLHPEPGDRILDAGCGLGHDVLLLADRVGSDGEVVGIDYSKELIRQANESAGDNPAVTFHTGSILDIDYPADSFDASRADRVLQHLDDPAAAIDELKRVTKPGGRLGLTDTVWESLLLDAPGADPPHKLLNLNHVDAVNPEIGRELYRYVKKAELREIDIDPILFYSTNFEEVRELGRLESWLDRMKEAGLVSDREIEEWLDRLIQANESGQFFSSLAAFTIVGTVPE
jgi:ubiquinone/menaquinone biosynthesis C-methylase UbiE